MAFFRSRNRLLLATALATFLAAGAPAFAQQATPEEAKRLEQTFQQAYKDAFTPLGSNVQVDGQVTVAVEDDHYRVNGPSILFGTKQDGLEVPASSMRMDPQGEGNFKVSDASIPGNIPIYAKGAKVAEITIGKQEFEGVWNEDTQQFIKMDVDFGDIKVSGQADNKAFTVALDSFTGSRDMKENSDDRYSGTDRYELKKFSVSWEQGSITLDRIAYFARQEQVDFKALSIINKMVTSLNGAVSSGQAPDEAVVREHAQTLVGRGMPIDTGLGQVVVENLKVENRDPKEAFSVTLDKLGYTVEAKDLRKEKGAFRLAFQGEGLEVTPAPATAGLIPQNFTFDIAVRDLPATMLWNRIGQVVLDQTKGGATTSPDQEMLGIVQDLAKAGVDLEVADVTVRTKDSAAEVKGSAEVRPANGGPVPVQLVGSYVGTIRNIDAVKEAIQADGKAKGRSDASIQNDMQGIDMVAGFGKKDGDTLTYKVDFREDGKIYLNDLDINAIMGGAGGR